MDERVSRLNDAPVRAGGRYVLYWCRWNRRVESNHALAYATTMANQMKLPLVFFERVTCNYESASARFHTFLLEGVPSLAAQLRKMGIGYVFQLPRRKKNPGADMRAVFNGAAAVVTDDCLRAIPALDVQFDAVDASCIVPASAIPSQCYAAYSIRPKIHRLLPRYLNPVATVRPRVPCQESFAKSHTEVTDDNIDALVSSCEVDHSVRSSTLYRGGRQEALRRLRRFLKGGLRRYALEKNEPSAHATSRLSPYLHYGHISALEVALAVREHARQHKLIADGFLEELIVRRELAFNFVRYTKSRDTLDALPEWARKTLHKHRRDRRDPGYARDEFDQASTHDELWNAAQKEFVLRGTIHGYYRMYWGKKILEWSATPQEALHTMLYLHDKYALDGDDPNTYTNILWCFGLHDRPWPERPIYGTVRSMARSGMERKTDTAAYVREIEDLECTGQERNL
jgi:deoxyribodipyrimidine photo-lyase